MFKQQIIGTINLSIPVLALAWLFPAVFHSVWGVIACSVAMGGYILYLNYKATKNHAAFFTYVPSGECKEEFEESIKTCELDPQVIQLRYGYTNEQIAFAAFRTIVIDPLLWQGITKDPVALEVKNILDLHIVKTLSEEQKSRMAKVHEIFSIPVQRFIFKHELGHVFHNYSNRKLAVIGVIGACATYAGISAAIGLQALLGTFAIPLGIFIGGLSDLVLSHASNVLFKVYEEKRADRFAVQYSSREDAEAAADFFERHHEILLAHQDAKNILAKLPSTVLSGHLSGKARADYIRACSRR